MQEKEAAFVARFGHVRFTPIIGTVLPGGSGPSSDSPRVPALLVRCHSWCAWWWGRL